jgi:hypothetical protein
LRVQDFVAETGESKSEQDGGFFHDGGGLVLQRLPGLHPEEKFRGGGVDE